MPFFLPIIMVQWNMAGYLEGNVTIGDTLRYTPFSLNHTGGKVKNCFRNTRILQVFCDPKGQPMGISDGSRGLRVAHHSKDLNRKPQQRNALPETNILPPKVRLPKRKFIFQTIDFQG